MLCISQVEYLFTNRKKYICTRWVAPLELVHLLLKDVTKLPPWNVIGATWLRLPRQLSQGVCHVTQRHQCFAFCQSHVTSNATDLNLNHIQGLRDVCVCVCVCVCMCVFSSRTLWTHKLLPQPGVNNLSSGASFFIGLCLFWGDFYAYTSESPVLK